MELIRPDGIRAEPTTPYTPEQNGVAERYNRIIVQMIRSMLVWAKLPHSFWGEAAMTANYLRNLLPTAKVDRSPEEKWAEQKPDICHLRTFGCLFTFISRRKIDPSWIKYPGKEFSSDITLQTNIAFIIQKRAR